jgi:hypothetical protein
MISENEARKLCNSVEIQLVLGSYPRGLRDLNYKKITTRIKNCEKAISYWSGRYTILKKKLDKIKKSGQDVPLIPEINMENYKKKARIFEETLSRYNQALKKIPSKKLIEKTISKKRK